MPMKFINIVQLMIAVTDVNLLFRESTPEERNIVMRLIPKYEMNEFTLRRISKKIEAYPGALRTLMADSLRDYSLVTETLVYKMKQFIGKNHN